MIGDVIIAPHGTFTVTYCDNNIVKYIGKGNDFSCSPLEWDRAKNSIGNKFVPFNNYIRMTVEYSKG